MSTLPPGIIFTDTAGLARAQPGYATVWIRDAFAERGARWLSEKGSIYFRAELAADGSRVNVPMFRAYASPLEDEPLSKFDGYTQP